MFAERLLPNAELDENMLMAKTGELPGATHLPAELVERGEILKSFVFENEDCSISLLTLFPGAKIREHTHTEDKECYFFIDKRVAQICSVGMSHSLENTTKNVLFVLSIKYKQ